METVNSPEDDDKASDKHCSVVNNSSNKKRLDKSKLISVHQSLLLACVYFDQTHTGYIVDKDLEDILHIMGLHLSRAQVCYDMQHLITNIEGKWQFMIMQLF